MWFPLARELLGKTALFHLSPQKEAYSFLVVMAVTKGKGILAMA
jgi:hypothetical protein